jgi:hypothetical protein
MPMDSCRSHLKNLTIFSFKHKYICYRYLICLLAHNLCFILPELIEAVGSEGHGDQRHVAIVHGLYRTKIVNASLKFCVADPAPPVLF